MKKKLISYHTSLISTLFKMHGNFRTSLITFLIIFLSVSCCSFSLSGQVLSIDQEDPTLGILDSITFNNYSVVGAYQVASSGNTIYSFLYGEWKAFEAPFDVDITSVTVDLELNAVLIGTHGEGVWFFSPFGEFFFSPEQLSRVGLEVFLSSKDKIINDVGSDHMGTIWIAVKDEGVLVGQNINEPELLEDPFFEIDLIDIKQLEWDNENQIMIGRHPDYMFLGEFDDFFILEFGEENGHFTDVYAYEEGILFLSTIGVIGIINGEFVDLRENYGALHFTNVSVAQDSSVWLVEHEKGIHYHHPANGNAFFAFEDYGLLPTSEVFDINQHDGKTKLIGNNPYSKIIILDIIPSMDNDMDGFDRPLDCDDTSADINPDADEIPDNDIDENCDGILGYSDSDGDGFDTRTDCDDSDSSINPDATEIANNDIDENCDGVVEMIDDDGDGFNSDQDCDDNDASINPDATEILNNDVDEDCNGIADQDDADGDGYNSEVDCNNEDPDINPDADEIPDNDVDENCDGVLAYSDKDGDGFDTRSDCDDNNPNINSEAAEIPNNDIDENCDGIVEEIDEDNDGFNTNMDCDDTDPNVFPNAIEIPNNNIDEDCDGEDQNIFSLAVDNYAVHVFPNPGSDILNINLFDGDGEIELRVWTMDGRLLNQQTLNLFNQIDINDWPLGLSLIEILHLNSRKRAYIKYVKVSD